MTDDADCGDRAMNREMPGVANGAAMSALIVVRMRGRSKLNA